MLDKTRQFVTRREVLALSGCAASLTLWTGSVLGQGRGPTEVTVDEANLRARPIAIPQFLGDDPRLAGDITRIIANNLEGSGLFKPLDQSAFIERISTLNIAPRFADWRSVGAEALVVGRVIRDGNGRAVAEFRLWDVVLGKQLAGQQFRTDVRNWRRVGHMISDQIYTKLTLEKGYFDTRVAFIDETGSKRSRQKRLAIMDQDGANVRMLSSGRELVLTPRFSPTNQHLTYMSYSGANPRVVLLDLTSGKREVVGDFSWNDVRAEVLAGRTAGDHEFSTRRLVDNRRNGLTFTPIPPTHSVNRHRHRAVLFAGWPLHCPRVRSCWVPAALYHGR